MTPARALALVSILVQAAVVAGLLAPYLQSGHLDVALHPEMRQLVLADSLLLGIGFGAAYAGWALAIRRRYGAGPLGILASGAVYSAGVFLVVWQLRVSPVYLLLSF